MKYLILMTSLWTLNLSIFAQSIHQIQQEQYKSFVFEREEDYDQLYPTTATKKTTATLSCPLTKQVFGYYPYWQGTYYTSMDYTALSTISYFSYEVNPANGTYNDIHFWKTTNLVPQAHAANVKVTLCATLFGSTDLTTFLSSTTSKQRCIDSLISLVQFRSADGVNIDFEGVPSAQKTNFTTFMNDLANAFHTQIPNSKVSAAIPAVDWNNSYDVVAMTAVDEFYIMGYDYYYGGSTTAGPTGLLYSGSIWYAQCVSKSINDYLVKGVPKQKLLLAVPYYGFEWSTNTNTYPSTTTSSGTAKTYSVAKTNSITYGYNYENQAQSAYYMYNSGGWKQTWYDDSTSLAKKYDVVLMRDLGGIGIWALGYQGNTTELEGAIKAKFSTCAVNPCTYTLYDMGGPNGTYFNKEKYIYTINPDGINQVSLSFNSFDVENNYDYLKIYDGVDTTVALLANLTGNTLPPTYTSSNQALTLKFTSDGATVKQGWVAQWTCSPLTSVHSSQLSTPTTYRIYPNPIQNVLNIEPKTYHRVEIINPLGQLLYRGNNPEVEHLSSGIYYVFIYSKDQVEKLSFIK